MTTVIFIIKVLLIALSVAMTAVVLMQAPKSGGAAMALSGETENFFGRTKTRGREGKLQKITKILAVAMGVFLIALAILPGIPMM